MKILKINLVQWILSFVASIKEKPRRLISYNGRSFSFLEMTGRKVFMTIACATVMLSSTNILAQQVQEDHLEGYLSIAGENNPNLKALFNQYLAAMERLPQAKALPDPTVMFNIFASPVETRVGAQTVGLSLNQAFPWFGQLKSQEEAAAYTAKARFEVFQDAKNKLFFQVKSIYYDLYVLESAIRITNENLRLLFSFRELANVRLEAGTGSAVDLLRVEMDIAELENQLKYLIDSREPIKTEFREMLNVELKIPIKIPDTLRTVGLLSQKNVLMDSVLLKNPSLKKFDFDINSFNSQIDVAKSMGKPSFNVGLGYTNISKRSGLDFSDNGRDALILPQIGIRIPLYRKKYTAMVKEREFLKVSSYQQKEDRKNRLFTELEKEWRNYQDANRRIQLYRYLISLADQSLDILVAEFTSAGKDFEEILRMDRTLLKYELELEKARADYNTNVAYINYLSGK